MIKETKRQVFFPLLYMLLGALLLTTVLVIQSFRNPGDDPEDKDNFDYYVVKSPVIPKNLEFAGENVPLDYFDIRESLDRELLVNTYFHSQTMWVIKRANRYFRLIEPVLEKYGIPDDFKYLAVTESNLSNVVSPAGAAGFWQLLSGTANDYGLEVNDEIDERYNIEKSTEAACKYFKESYDTYENWTLVAASYNAGRKGINLQVERQKETNYYDLLLNDETARYMFRILAFKIIMNNPSKYGFNIRKEDLYPPVPTYDVIVDTSVDDFADFAKSYGINYKLLKIFNPWLREKYLTNKNRKTYVIKIPEKGYRNYEKLMRHSD